MKFISWAQAKTDLILHAACEIFNGSWELGVALELLPFRMAVFITKKDKRMAVFITKKDKRMAVWGEHPPNVGEWPNFDDQQLHVAAQNCMLNDYNFGQERVFWDFISDLSSLKKVCHNKEFVRND